MISYVKWTAEEKKYSEGGYRGGKTPERTGGRVSRQKGEDLRGIPGKPQGQNLGGEEHAVKTMVGVRGLGKFRRNGSNPE